MSAKTLNDDELQELLQKNLKWQLEGGCLVREWTFKDFAAAMSFVNQAAGLAEAANHHPDIDIRYNRVKLALISHDVGGISQRDAAMVRDLDTIS